MKRTIVIYILVLFFGVKLQSQGLENSDFKVTNWFSINQDNLFYTADTIYLIRIPSFNSYRDSVNELNIILQYNSFKDHTELKFLKSGRLFVEDLNVESWTDTKRVGKWRWKFDEGDQILTLFFNKNIDSTFKILKSSSDTIIQNYEDTKTKSKITMMILQLVRIKT
jgi:hypothetical protein